MGSVGLVRANFFQAVRGGAPLPAGRGLPAPGQGAFDLLLEGDHDVR